MILTKRQQSLFRGNGSGVGTLSARETADAVITALTPAAWYRNATGVTSAGGFASQWDDYSGNTRHLVQAVGTNQPAYSAGVFTFDGADNVMKVTGGFTLNQPVTYYYVMSQESWTSGDYLQDGNTNDSGIIYQVSATPNLAINFGTLVPTNPDLAIGTVGIFAFKANGASSSARLNDNAAATGNCGANNPGGFTLGGRASQVSSFFHGTVKEIVIFAAAHDDATQSNVITALNNALTVF